VNNDTLKSIGAIFAGAIIGALPALGTDQLMHATGVFPPPDQAMSGSLFLLATAYRAIYGVAGSYVAARLAPSRPMLHALILGAIGVAVCVVGTAVTWNKGPEFGPHWYPLALVALGMPQAWVGGKLAKVPSPARAG